MNANGARFILVNTAADFADAGLAWDEAQGAARMPAADTPRLADVGRAAALAAWESAAPLCEDEYGQIGVLSDDRTRLEVAFAFPPTDRSTVEVSTETGAILEPVAAPSGTTFADLHLGAGERAALAFTDGAARFGVSVVDLARRWQRRVEMPGPVARVWVAGEIVFAASDTHLYRLDGGPLPQPYRPRPDRFEPVAINPDPLRLTGQHLLPAGWRLLAMVADDGAVLLLMERDDGSRQALLRHTIGALGIDVIELPELPFAVDLRFLGALVVLMLPADPADTGFARCDLPVVRLPATGSGTAQFVARRYPQPSQARARFVGAAEPRIVTERGPKRLWPLPQSRYGPRVEATFGPFDSGGPGTAWHRLVAELCLPSGTELSVAARAFEGPLPEGPFIAQPAPVWLGTGSELAFDAGRFAPVPERDGAFEVILQRDDGPVRQLRGRRLELRLSLASDGRRSPAIAALRLYTPRGSWQERYLPEHLRQHEAVSETSGPANGADVRERLLAAFEGMLTPIEDRIAQAQTYLAPDAAPQDQLPRLAAMLGARLPVWPIDRQRRYLAMVGEMQRTKGTLTGLCLALDVATDGMVAKSLVVPVEVYRLRRTMATILGIEMDDRDHPLTLGTGQSGNSIVGDTLILSEETAREFLALFAPELAQATGDAAAVDAFFDRHAHRVDVVVHAAAAPLLATIEETLRESVPAGVRFRIIESEQPFVLGLSPLLGLDTLIENNPAWRKVVLGDTRLGREGILESPVAFAPEAVTRAGGSP